MLLETVNLMLARGGVDKYPHDGIEMMGLSGCLHVMFLL